VRAELARRHVLDFTRWTKEDYETNWHHAVLCAYLDRMVTGDLRRLMVFMPPRHGKSELVSRRLPAYILGRLPDASIIACSYSADLAQRMNRDVQRIVDGERYAETFPGTRLYGANVRTVSQGSYLRNSDIFEVVGHRGVYRSAGVGGGITGMGFEFGIIDDPIKNREEAESLTYRESLWDWYTSTFRTRAEKDARILITLTRWNEDDLAGRLLNLAKGDPDADQWTVLRLPALFDGLDPSPDDPRQMDEPLWPNKYGPQALAGIRAAIGGYQWQGLYQQSPAAREGNRFKRAWFKFVDAAPADARRVRYWDKAGTEAGGKYSAGVKVAKSGEGLFYVEDVTRGQWSALERERVIEQTADLDDRGPHKTIIYHEQEPGSGGKESAEATTRRLAGHAVYADKVTGSKDIRLDPFQAQCEAGNVYLVRGPWNEAFIEELCAIPNGRFRDQSDAAGGAFNKLTEGGSDWGDVAGLGRVEEYSSRWK